MTLNWKWIVTILAALFLLMGGVTGCLLKFERVAEPEPQTVNEAWDSLIDAFEDLLDDVDL